MNSRMAIFLLKIDHLTEDFVVCLASGKFVLDIRPQLSIIWLWMMLIGDWMVSVGQDRGFQGQNPLGLCITLWKVKYLVEGSCYACGYLGGDHYSANDPL